MLKSINKYLSLVKFSHTIFAMPFALFSFTLAWQQTETVFSWKLLLLIVLCMVFARNAAMGFNRYADRKIDAKNQRTAQREIPSGKINPTSALLFVIVNCVLFVVAAGFINRLCLLLSPLALLVVLGYSYTKRFTFLCHFVLGLGLAMSVAGTYIAVTATLPFVIIILSLLVLLWTAGFDIIYALHDETFDQQEKLFSIPAYFGIKNALIISAAIHFMALVCIVLVGYLIPLHIWGVIGTALFIGLLVFQHLIVKPSNLQRINAAFATTNGLASLLYCSFCILDLVTR